MTLRHENSRSSGGTRRRVYGLIPGLLAAFILVLPGPVLTGIYKWTDADGNVHYGERPPPDAQSRELPSAPPPPEADVMRSQERLDRLLERQQRSEQLRQEDQVREAQEEEQAARLAADRRQRCIAARNQMHRLRMQRAIYTIDEQGERVYLDDEARSRLIELRQREIEAFCD
jgi:hypothetical protein